MHDTLRESAHYLSLVLVIFVTSTSDAED